MLKVEIDDQALLPMETARCAKDDVTYIMPSDGEIEYELPSTVAERGVVRKLGIVFGSGRIDDLRIQIKFK